MIKPGYRKFTIFLIVLIASIPLLVLSYLNGSNFADIVGGGLIAFMSANIGEHILKTVQGAIAKKNE